MAGSHRTRSRRQFSVALVSAATATATALTVGVQPPPDPAKRASAESVDLAAATQLLPTHDKVSDITGGLGSTIYDRGQVLSDAVIRAIVNGIDLSALPKAAGVDLSLVIQLLKALKIDGIDGVPLNLVTSGPAFAALKMLGVDLGWVPALPNSLANEINNTPYARLGVDGVLDLLLGELKNSPLAGAAALIKPLTDLLGLITNQIPDAVDVRVIPTVGMGFGAYAAAMAYEKVLADLSMQPGGLDHVFGADPILGSLTVLPLILINNPARPDGGALARFGALAALLGINTVNPTTEFTSNGNGFSLPGLGTGVELGHANLLPVLVDATYEYQPLSDLASWPNPFTLANNLAAGLSPTYMLRGLDLDLGGLTGQILKGVNDALGGINPLDPDSALAINLYLTLHTSTLPLLEPLYLTSDVLNVVGLHPLAQIPMRLANALAPALRILTDVGYANTVRNEDGTYTRDFDDAGTEVPFMSFPKLDPGLVLNDAFKALVAGFQKELGPNPTPGTPNVLSNLLDALRKGGLLDNLLNLITPPSAAKTTTAALSKTAAADVPSPSAQLLSVVPSSGEVAKDAAPEHDSKSAQKQSASGETTAAAGEKTPAPGEEAQGEEGDKSSVVGDGTGGDKTSDTTPAAGDKTPDAGDKTPDAGDKTGGDKPTAANEDPKPASGPKHAKPEGDSTPTVSVKTGKTNAPKHAKPEKPNGAGVKTGSDKTQSDGGSADKAA
ncbi:hypothetical protein [Mycobacterium sp. AT1]|uniref:hypothetical protein n=1 Tax=Mycobacterium sp. AT1 TaxID=1961706 RepID=UPI00114FCFDC|nr:hypothetical protein [Mycobacterium sp. AT1]